MLGPDMSSEVQYNERDSFQPSRSRGLPCKHSWQNMQWGLGRTGHRSHRTGRLHMKEKNKWWLNVTTVGQTSQGQEATRCDKICSVYSHTHEYFIWSLNTWKKTFPAFENPEMMDGMGPLAWESSLDWEMAGTRWGRGAMTSSHAMAHSCNN